MTSEPSAFRLSRSSLRTVLWALAACGAAFSGLSGCSEDVPGGNTGGGPATGGAMTGGSPGTGGGGSGGAPSGGAPAGGSGGAPAGGTEAGGSGGATGGGGTGGDGTGGVIWEELPELLSETGLFSDISTMELAADVREFAPQFPLWTDGAQKNRYVHLPPGEKVDTTDMDNWTYPVGTKFWKHFIRDDILVETRLIARVRDGGRGWKGVAYIWNEDHSEAMAAPNGMDNALGTEHDVPEDGACQDCHGDRDDWPLGFGALQLSYDSDLLDIADLDGDSLLSAPPAEPIVLPGTAEEQAVLGYLHANCGSCHRTGAGGTDRSGLAMWVTMDSLADVTDTDTYKGLVNQMIGAPESQLPYRVYGGDPDKSELYRRITVRGQSDMMPPLGTEIVHAEGAAMIEAWINSLPPPPTP